LAQHKNEHSSLISHLFAHMPRGKLHRFLICTVSFSVWLAVYCIADPL